MSQHLEDLESSPDSEPAEQSLPSSSSWLEELRRVSTAVSKKGRHISAHRKQIFYYLHWSADAQNFGITVHQGSEPEKSEEYWSIERAITKTPPFAHEEDIAIFRLLWAERMHDCSLRAFGLGPLHGVQALEKILKTGRLCTADDFSPLLHAAERPASLGWRFSASGLQSPYWQVQPEAPLIIPLDPPYYVDLDLGVIGALDIPAKLGTLSELFSLPPLSATEVEHVMKALADAHFSSAELAQWARPKPEINSLRRIIDVPLQPILSLQTLNIYGHRNWRDYPFNDDAEYFDVAIPTFRYLDVDLYAHDPSTLLTLADGESVQILRRTADEKIALDQLLALGLQKIPQHVLHTFGSPPSHIYGLNEENAWLNFMHAPLESLCKTSWQVAFDPDFRHHALQVDAWEAELLEAENGWFDLDMGIIVEGTRLALAPLLAALFRSDPRWLNLTQINKIADDEAIELRTPDRRRIRVAAERLKPLASTLLDLFDGFSGSSRLRVSRFDAPRLNELMDTRRWQFRGQSDVLALADRLAAAQAITDIEPPAGLGLQLRSYQREGLAWLQFLREQNLSGILADDMGLGKTAQALAHLLLEKEAGRLDKPALIVLPTSLIFNWKNEAARFAPSLSVLSLHGAERKSRYAEILTHDVVMTTYPLLWRDAAILTQHQYHLLILDEAQTVKNARSQGAEVVRKIDARHRLCLTGTPLENHLGELWSQFDFLLPGFLGNRRTFSKYWRAPIEKEGDVARRDLLARRIRPFILRRKKEEVAQELPPKTIIVRKVELAGSQRDLYETVRAAMDSMVREEVAQKGFGRSQMVILDALLKLRQVCCDPRLVKAAAAQRVTEHAKLDLLMTMLPEQVAEGARILVFSQFTSMLALIQTELKAANLDYVILTGDTPDRETPVKRFQAGEVPIFLISLKAGGVGLNLTAADTVIHYDPWWNPAVENQATDRAHRLGQDKPVFVYKLIVAGSIEEKILALQERKASLVDGILSADHNVSLKFGQDDLSALFSPLPD